MITTTHEYPKLREDVVLSRRTHGDDGSFVVNDPRTQRFFLLREAEVFIARQLDGHTPLEVVRRRVEERFRQSLTDEKLAQFVKTLERLALLEASGEGGDAATSQSRRVRGSLLYLRCKAFDPDRFLERLHRKVRFFFTPAFVALSAVTILVAIGVVVADYDLLGRGLARLFQVDALVLAWFVLMGVMICHEFAHGLACKHFGGRVHEMGFMLIFFQPAMYCNVSDAWLFPRRSHRLWVTFAGAWFEMFLWALATLIWRVTDPNTVINFVALVVMMTSGIKTLFNLNPLIKLDGYYLLADLLDVPNLNRRASAYIRGRVGRVFGGGDSADAEETPRRERRIYWIYGLLAGVFSFTLLAWILTRFGRHLTENYQAIGVLVTAALAFALFRGQLTALVVKPAVWVARAPKRRAVKLLAAFALVAAILLVGHMPLRVSAPVTVLPTRHADIRAEVDSLIEEVFVEENDLVEAGQLVVRLRERGLRADRDKTVADIAATKARLKMLEVGARPEEIEVARREVETAQTRLVQRRREYATAEQMHKERLAKAKTSIEKAETQLKGARDERERLELLVVRQAGSAKELREAVLLVAVREKELEEARAELRWLLADDLAALRDAVVVAEKELEAARGRLDLLLAGAREEEIEATQAHILRLEAHRAYDEKQIHSLDVVTPTAGVVVTPKMRDKIGQLVQKGDLILSVHDLARIRAEIAVPETEIGDIQVGQKVALKVRAYPGRTFEGKVTSIAAAAAKNEDELAGKIIRVTAEVANSSFELKPEMTGHAKIECGDRRILDVATRRFVRYVRVEFWSWW